MCYKYTLSRKNGSELLLLCLRESLPQSGKTVLIKLIAAFFSVHYRLSVHFFKNQINVFQGKVSPEVTRVNKVTRTFLNLDSRRK